MIASIRVGLLIACTMLAACSESPTPQSAPATPSQPSATSHAATGQQPTGPATPETPDLEAPARTPVNDPAADPVADPVAQAKRGRAVYTANCIACHNPDPSLDGAIGPAIAGSSLELVEARVMRNEYPEGYKPKRDTKAMIPLPYLENDLVALAAFLAR